jgi:HEAT repeat protein
MNSSMNKNEIKAATNQALLERFEQTAVIHRELNTAEESSRAFDEGVTIWMELKRRGREGVDFFLRLLHSPNPAVRMNAASLALLDEPEQAEPILQQLTSEPRLLGFSARMTLKKWRAGELKPLE